MPLTRPRNSNRPVRRGHRYYGVTRVNPDGSLDESFNADLGNGPWGGLALQLDGKVVAGGYSDGEGFRPMRRLLDDGSSDPDWNAPSISGGDGVVYAVLLQPDGKVLFGGNNLLTPDTSATLGRLKVDGTLDTTFDARGDLHYYNDEFQGVSPLFHRPELFSARPVILLAVHGMRSVTISIPFVDSTRNTLLR